MSPVPANPLRPDSSSSACCTGPSARPPYCCTHSTSPGSMLPARVAITRPSSGVIPIVVSTLRPPRTAQSDAPAPRCAVTSARSSGARPSRAAAGARRVGVREAVEAEPPQRPGVAPLLRQRVRRGRGRDRRVERGVEARDVRDVGQQVACLADQLQRARLVQRRERGERAEPADHVVVDDHRVGELGPAVHDPVPHRVDPVDRRDERAEVVRVRLRRRRRPRRAPTA